MKLLSFPLVVLCSSGRCVRATKGRCGEERSANEKRDGSVHPRSVFSSSFNKVDVALSAAEALKSSGRRSAEEQWSTLPQPVACRAKLVKQPPSPRSDVAVETEGEKTVLRRGEVRIYR
jgi:hypothetical protein